jgi:hypothetical protein
MECAALAATGFCADVNAQPANPPAASTHYAPLLGKPYTVALTLRQKLHTPVAQLPGLRQRCAFGEDVSIARNSPKITSPATSPEINIAHLPQTQIV